MDEYLADCGVVRMLDFPQQLTDLVGEMMTDIPFLKAVGHSWLEVEFEDMEEHNKFFPDLHIALTKLAKELEDVHKIQQKMLKIAEGGQ